MNGAGDGFMDGSFVVVVVGTLAIITWALLTVGPSCPDSEKQPEKAAEEMGRGMAGVFGVGLILCLIIWGVIAL